MTWHALWAWFNRDLWAPMWPNMFAPSVITLVAVVFSHFRLKAHQKRNHEEQMQALNNSSPN